jgi:HEAT repeat protein
VRALPALTALYSQKDATLQIAAVRATGMLGAKEAAPALLPLVDADDAGLRFEAARALRTCADAATVRTLLARLEGRGAADRHALLVALGGALPRAEANRTLDAELHDAALHVLGNIARGEDDALADRAMDAIGVWAPKGALEALAPNLRSPSARRRATATMAIGQLQTQESRKVLRYLLTGKHTRDAAAAAIALAEIGDERDLAALVKASKRQHWPVPGAAAFSLARMAQRGALRPHAAARALCDLGRSREPYVRANVAAALAALAARPCEEDGPDPLRWLAPEHTPIVRAAAARWTHAALAAGKLDAAAAQSALARCSATDVEPAVRALCTVPAAVAAVREPADVYAYAPDGTTLLRNRLVALRLADGAVFLGYTDLNGHVRLPRAPRGELRLEQPELMPLEAAH